MAYLNRLMDFELLSYLKLSSFLQSAKTEISYHNNKKDLSKLFRMLNGHVICQIIPAF